MPKIQKYALRPAKESHRTGDKHRKALDQQVRYALGSRDSVTPPTPCRPWKEIVERGRNVAETP